MGVRGCCGVRPRTWWLRTTQLILRQAGSRKSGVASRVQVPAGLASPGGSRGTVSLYLPAAEVSALLASWPRTTWPLLSLRPHHAAVCLSCSQTPFGLPFIRLTSHIDPQSLGHTPFALRGHISTVQGLGRGRGARLLSSRPQWHNEPQEEMRLYTVPFH